MALFIHTSNTDIERMDTWIQGGYMELWIMLLAINWFLKAIFLLVGLWLMLMDRESGFGTKQ